MAGDKAAQGSAARGPRARDRVPAYVSIGRSRSGFCADGRTGGDQRRPRSSRERAPHETPSARDRLRYKVPASVLSLSATRPPPHPALPASEMSPIALPTQHAAVLYGAKDLRFEERTLWPPHQGQAQVAVVSTGLCGSDCKSSIHIHPLLLLQPSFFFPIQYTTTPMDVTATSSSRLPSSSVTKLPVSSLQSALVLRTLCPASASPSRPASCATTAHIAPRAATTSARTCASAAAQRPSPTMMVPSRNV